MTGLAALCAAALLAGCGNVSVGAHTENRSYEAPGTTALKVRSPGGRVEIVASDSGVVRVRERLSWTNDRNKPKARHSIEGGTLSLSATCAPAMFGTACGISYRVEVPRSLAIAVDNRDGSIRLSGHYKTVSLTSGSGSIDASDMTATSLAVSAHDGSIRVSGRVGTADLRTGSGSVTTDGLTADRLSVRTHDGGITVDGRASTAELRTGSGSITAETFTASRLTARTGDGHIHLALTDPPNDVRATSGSGSVRLSVPGGAGYAITLSTDSGSRNIDPGVHQDSRSSRRITLTSGDGSVSVDAS
ncbi:DUF4097 family beta strand repeat-containing protein [Spirillospora albida]|uniref:DUF4097 family beta strand repeat-containing protein n=1 Tax=Spirillospora albida TaxID=58123 RepID=UPI0012FB03F4|nr:DUF4097 family beta strand repeat-containing protein [Spirillospora albida]